MVQADEPGPCRVSEATEVSGPSGIPGTTGVSESSQVQAGHSTEKEDDGAGRHVRRSTRAVKILSWMFRTSSFLSKTLYC